MTLHQKSWKCKSGNTWNKDVIVKNDLVWCTGLLGGLLLHWLSNCRILIHISKRYQKLHSAVGLVRLVNARVFLIGFTLGLDSRLLYGHDRIHHYMVGFISAEWFAALLLQDR